MSEHSPTAAPGEFHCNCPKRDPWRCAMVRGISSVTCPCACHRAPAPPPVESASAASTPPLAAPGDAGEPLDNQLRAALSIADRITDPVDASVIREMVRRVRVMDRQPAPREDGTPASATECPSCRARMIVAFGTILVCIVCGERFMPASAVAPREERADLVQILMSDARALGMNGHWLAIHVAPKGAVDDGEWVSVGRLLESDAKRGKVRVVGEGHTLASAMPAPVWGLPVSGPREEQADEPFGVADLADLQRRYTDACSERDSAVIAEGEWKGRALDAEAKLAALVPSGDGRDGDEARGIAKGVIAHAYRLLDSRDAWQEYAEHLEYCRTCAETGYEDCDEGVRLRKVAWASASPVSDAGTTTANGEE